MGIFTTETHRVISTISLIGLFLISIYGIKERGLKNLKLNKPVLLLTLIFFMHLIDGVLTDFLTNTDYFQGRLILKVPFLLMPFSILFLPKLSEKRFHFLILTFILCSFYISLNAGLYYIKNTDAVHEMYLRSKAIPLPLNHVRYSLMLSMSIFLGAFLYIKKTYFYSPAETKIIAIITLFLFVFLHLLSVRSGLLAFYILTVVVAFGYALKTKKYKLVSIALLIFAMLPVISYFSIGTFRNKVANTIEDVRNTKYEYYANFHSLTARVFSYKVAWHLIKENPLTGVGIGNLEREVNKAYIENFAEIQPKSRLKPHNQFFNYTTSFGFIGLALFILGFYGVLFFKKYRSDIILLVNFLILTISFLFESTLETQLGANFALCFIIIPLYFIISNGETKEGSL